MRRLLLIALAFPALAFGQLTETHISPVLITPPVLTPKDTPAATLHYHPAPLPSPVPSGPREDPGLRGFNVRGYRNPDGTVTRQYYVGHIHYVPDPRHPTLYAPIDCALVETAGGWEMTRASYRAFVPAYADGTIRFRNLFRGRDETLRASPVAGHIAGSLVSDTQVVYLGCFGAGKDLIVRTAPMGLREYARIRSKPPIYGDLLLDFQLLLPAGVDLPDGPFTGKGLKVGASRFSSASVWDAAGHRRPVPISIYHSAGKTYLRKSVPADFLAAETTVYPILTDHCTDFAAGAGDSKISRTAFPWGMVHDSASGDARDDMNDGALVHNYPDHFSIERGTCPIDTTGATGTITAASLFVYKKTVPGADDDMDVVLTTMADPTATALADYGTFGTDIGGTIANASIVSGWNEIVLNATGRSWINPSGYTKLGFRIGQDIANSPTTLGAHGAYFEPSESLNGPYLSVTTGGATATGQVISVNQ